MVGVWANRLATPRANARKPLNEKSFQMEAYEEKIVLDAAKVIQELSKSGQFDGLTPGEVAQKCVDIYGGSRIIALLDALRNL
jgi:hypothetical protein